MSQIPYPIGLNIALKEKWKNEWKGVDESNDPDERKGYVTAILKISAMIMGYIDAESPTTLDAEVMIHRANREAREGITGNMAAYVAFTVGKYHVRGDEFRKSWNTSWGKPDIKGTVNPAVMHI